MEDSQLCQRVKCKDRNKPTTRYYVFGKYYYLCNDCFKAVSDYIQTMFPG